MISRIFQWLSRPFCKVDTGWQAKSVDANTNIGHLPGDEIFNENINVKNNNRHRLTLSISGQTATFESAAAACRALGLRRGPIARSRSKTGQTWEEALTSAFAEKTPSQDCNHANDKK